jgi:hypothetical protein
MGDSLMVWFDDQIGSPRRDHFGRMQRCERCAKHRTVPPRTRGHERRTPKGESDPHRNAAPALWGLEGESAAELLSMIARQAGACNRPHK